MRWSQWTVLGTAVVGRPAGHELEEGHLGGGVLHGHPVGVEVVVRATTLDQLGGVAEVVEEDLLGEGERPAEAGPPAGGALRERGVDLLDEFDRRSCSHGHGSFPCVGGRM
ncbi:MAG: hypothetical protein R2694_07255 [Ilumatobacteraceae bacterium]